MNRKEYLEMKISNIKKSIAHAEEEHRKHCECINRKYMNGEVIYPYEIDFGSVLLIDRDQREMQLEVLERELDRLVRGVEEVPSEILRKAVVSMVVEGQWESLKADDGDVRVYQEYGFE